MTTFVDHQHSRATDGRCTAKDHPEAELEFGAPAIALAEATGDWGPRFHDMDSRPANEYTPTERAAAALRAQFGTAPDAEVDGAYCFEGPNRQVLKIRATGRVAVNFPDCTRVAAETNMLSVMDPLPLGRLGSDPDGEVCRWLVGPDDFNAEDALKVLASYGCPERFEDISRAILRLEQRTRPDASLLLQVLSSPLGRLLRCDQQAPGEHVAHRLRLPEEHCAMSAPTWQNHEILAAAAGPQGPQVQAVFEKAANIGLEQSQALRKASDLHQKFVTDNSPAEVDYDALGLAAVKLAVSAAAAAGRQDALDQILGSWRNLAQAIATDLFLQMHRHTRPDSAPPSGDALERAATATATPFEIPVGHALIALAARDLIDADGFPQEAYDFLTTPWNWAFGAAHPDDDTGQTVAGS